jgi:hypothetical protein
VVAIGLKFAQTNPHRQPVPQPPHAKVEGSGTSACDGEVTVVREPTGKGFRAVRSPAGSASPRRPMLRCALQRGPELAYQFGGNPASASCSSAHSSSTISATVSRASVSP